MSMPRGRVLITLITIVAAATFLGAGAWIHSHYAEPRFSEPELPQEFRALRNPFAGDANSAEEGRGYFMKGCAPCHGPNADGRGPAARGLDPAPADFRFGPILREHSDAYVFWRITEGKHGTAMPRWNGVYDARQRWTIVTYLRSLEGK